MFGHGGGGWDGLMTFPVWSLSRKMLLIMLNPKTLCNLSDGIDEYKVEHDPIVNVLCTCTSKRLTSSSLCIHSTKQNHTTLWVKKNIPLYFCLQQRVYQTKVQDVNDWLTCGLTCSRASLTMQLTSGGSICTPVFEPEEDILSMHCDSRTILINAARWHLCDIHVNYCVWF